MATSMSRARAAKEVVKKLLAGVEGVSGIGLTWDDNGKPSVLVNVQTHGSYLVSSRLSGATLSVPVIVEEMGVVTFEKEPSIP